MYKLYSIVLLLCFLQPIHAEDFSIVNTKGSAQLQVTEKNEVYTFTSVPKSKDQKAASYARKSIKIPAGSNVISFEVKGDGSNYFASIFLGESKWLHNSHEAIFSLRNTDWHKVTIPFSSFSRNDKPWSPVADMGLDSVYLKPSKIQQIGFGRLNVYSRHNHPNYSFSIRNINFSQANKAEVKIKGGLDNTKSKLTNKQSLNVLLLGDSITFQGKDQNHTYFAFEQLNALKHSNIVNAAMGGHTSRAGNTILSRSLAKMPNPDLTVIFFGANDCKAIQEGNGFNSAVFEKQLLQLIKNVSARTNGKSEFLLINGVPRVEKGSLVSTGAVEKITSAYKKISKEHQLVLCDTIELYNQLPMDQKKAYYKDTVHQTSEGLQFIGKQIALKLK